jgi:hypothetical protein
MVNLAPPSVEACLFEVISSVRFDYICVSVSLPIKIMSRKYQIQDQEYPYFVIFTAINWIDSLCYR